ncbi:MAG: hypothetical protein C5B50_16800 [Verrucomicrobia bacterium]|nr:MAG: hypothetical protein C5B50_16800 [Verrucomicrobiota bacterium]
MGNSFFVTTRTRRRAGEFFVTSGGLIVTGCLMRTCHRVLSVAALFGIMFSIAERGSGTNVAGAEARGEVIFKYCGKWPKHVRGPVYGLQVVGKHVYAVLMGSGLVIYEITPTGDLLQKGVWPVAGVWSVCVRGHYAYLGLESDGLAIIDIRSPEKPYLVGRFKEAKRIQSLDVYRDIAFLPNDSDGSRGILLVNVANPATPVKLGEIQTGAAVRGFAVSGDHAFIASVASGNSGLQIFNCRDPANPKRVGEFQTRGLAIAVSIFRNRAYLLESPDCLRILDVSDPSRPMLMGSLAAIEDSYSHWDCIWISGKYAYLGGYSDLDVVDVSDPKNPRLAKRIQGARARSIAGAEHWLISGGDVTLSAFDITDPHKPMLRGDLPIFGYANDVKFQGHYAFLADGGCLRVLDVSNPGLPRAVTHAETRGFAEAVCIVGKLAFVVDSYCPDGPMISETTPSFGLQIFDISDPTRLIKVNESSVATHNHFSRVAVATGCAYLLDGRFDLVDLSDLKHPRLQHYSDTTNRFGFKELCVVSNRLYGVGWEGIHIFDLTRPLQPRLLGTYSHHTNNLYFEFGSVDLAWPHAYVGSAEHGIEILDVENPSKPKLVGSANSDGAVASLQVAGNYLVAVDEVGVKAFNITNPAHPVLAGQSAIREINNNIHMPLRVRVLNNFAYVCSWRDLIVLEMQMQSRR